MNEKMDVETTAARDYRKMPDTDFAALGDGVVAYIRPMTSDDVTAAFPQAPRLAPGLELWALLSADGTPILITDDRNAAIANARENDLVAVSVH
ncbi:DUF1150 family protein [Methylobrevis pamukkalensis]|uniref:NADH oxidase n=1 Tax=Methylobrevis pamukkalensis TaxID=1439726 RepID=A0A1E3GZ70_9HYPH|nr:DUF1150 domain-containing protein [Methylobrevis pamukkalensis]ODN69367.1 hypothetical protein A6302_03318 [Methylobrevis pamukkalensis]